MNKKGTSTFTNLVVIVIFVFLGVYFFAPGIIGMQESSQKHRAAIGKFFNGMSSILSFRGGGEGPKKYGEVSRESDPFKEADKRRPRSK